MATLLTNAGKAIISNRIKGSGTEPNYVAIGTGTTAAAATDTAIETEVETRAAGTSSQVTTTTTNDSYSVDGTVSITANRAIANAGLMDAISSGNLLLHAVFSVINLVSGDSLRLVAKVVLS